MARKKRDRAAPRDADRDPIPAPAPAPPPAPPALTGKHRQTLADLFARPERANIPWNDFVALMTATGAVVTAGGGSAHSFVFLGRVLVVHRPHPGNELPRPAVKRIRRFLAAVGVRP
jgi:hypothetical protein